MASYPITYQEQDYLEELTRKMQERMYADTGITPQSLNPSAAGYRRAPESEPDKKRDRRLLLLLLP